MGDIAVRAVGLSKSFQIGSQQRRNQNFREVIVNASTAPFKRMGRILRGDSYGAADAHETFWALNDVSFEIKHGEVVGIIGRNGAGKSTLLKILSRITEPTKGYADIYGRIGALLEVGTGFHPELTGRENVYLNGTILGMKRKEIERKFDEIVAFAEIEKFIDTPVKHYSSGMGLRLGFAVAAHLEPEILVVDEVLAVGDVKFQRKCLDKMSTVAKEGRTVLFVSHNMAAVKTLCKRGVLLDAGRVQHIDNVQAIVDLYIRDNVSGSFTRTFDDPATAPGNNRARLCSIRLLNTQGASCGQFDISEDYYLEVEYAVIQAGTELNLSISAYNQEEVYILASPSISDTTWSMRPHPVGVYRSRCHIPANLLNAGQYSFSVLLIEHGRHVIAQVNRSVTAEMFDGGANRGVYFGYWGGVVRPNLAWVTERLSE